MMKIAILLAAVLCTPALAAVHTTDSTGPDHTPKPAPLISHQ